MTDKIENTCGNCPDLKIAGREGIACAGCGLTELVIPHEWNGVDNKFTFWRVPTNCPRNDVIKSDKQAPKSDWIVKTFKQLTPNNPGNQEV